MSNLTNKDTHTPVAPFRLTTLLSPVSLWLVAWGLGVAVAVSTLGLLTVSGYFLTVAGLGMASVGTSASVAMLSGLIRNFAIVRTVGRYGDLMVSHYAIFGLLQKLRVCFFNAFSQLPISDRLAIGSATAQYRLVKDIDTLNEFPLKIVSPFVVVGVALFLASLVLSLLINLPPMWIVFVVGLALLFVATAHKFIKASSTLQETRQTRLLYALPALTQLSLWGKWQGVIDDIGVFDKALSASQKQQSRHGMWATFVVQSVLIGVVLLVLYWGADRLVLTEGLTVAMLLAVVFGLFGLMEVASSLTADVSAFAKVSLAKDHLNTLIGNPTTQTTKPMPTHFDIELVGVSAYQVGAVFGLDNVNTTIKQGVPCVIMGASGAGKSTLLQTLAGELSPKAGQMALVAEGERIAMCDVDWQGELGFLGQQVDIFDQTLADNLRLGKQTASDDELWQALELVGLSDWAKNQPNALATPLGEYGVGISGGQARRIALARLLLSPKKVLLLDEPFAGLDRPNRQRLWEVLKARQADGILVVVSHHDEMVGDGVKVLKVG